MMGDLISRQAAIDAVNTALFPKINTAKDAEKVLRNLPSAQPERLTDDDFETIRIHLSAYKERLCNQHRWKEAEEYQRIIDRFMSFANAQPEIIHCKDCVNYDMARNGINGYCCFLDVPMYADDWCSRAERKKE
jgi:hypothetical protein